MKTLIDLSQHGWTETEINYLESDEAKCFYGFFPELVRCQVLLDTTSSEYHSQKYLEALQAYNIRNERAVIQKINFLGDLSSIFGSILKYLIYFIIIAVFGVVLYFTYPFIKILFDVIASFFRMAFGFLIGIFDRSSLKSKHKTELTRLKLETEQATAQSTNEAIKKAFVVTNEVISDKIRPLALADDKKAGDLYAVLNYKL